MGKNMINYDKLKEADKLAQKAIEAGHKSIVIEYNFDYGLARTGGHCLYLGVEGHDLELCDIDEVIDKLKELTKPEPKYNIGDEVWHLDSKGAWSFTVNRIAQDETGVSYEKGGVYPEWFLEESLYPSKESLIKSQIEYWQSLEEEEESYNEFASFEDQKCEHESDGKLYANYDMSCNDPFKCRKCGEFYR